MLEKVKKIPKSAILYLVLAIFMILAVSMKVNYYIDEIYTYGLSNYNGNGIDMEIEYDKTYTPGTSVYDDYMKVQNGQRFDYVNVWRNQTNDVHPPLYYALIHTIEQNRCAMACQGCGAVLFLLKSSGITFHNPLLLSYHTKQLN